MSSVLFRLSAPEFRPCVWGGVSPVSPRQRSGRCMFPCITRGGQARSRRHQKAQVPRLADQHGLARCLQRPTSTQGLPRYKHRLKPHNCAPPSGTASRPAGKQTRPVPGCLGSAKAVMPQSPPSPYREITADLKHRSKGIQQDHPGSRHWFTIG